MQDFVMPLLSLVSQKLQYFASPPPASTGGLHELLSWTATYYPSRLRDGVATEYAHSLARILKWDGGWNVFSTSYVIS